MTPERPINCEGGPTLLWTNSNPLPELQRGGLPFDLTFCPLVQPVEADSYDEALAKAFTGTDTATRDVTLAGGGDQFVEQGNSVAIPFKARWAGPKGGSLDLTASVSPAIPGLADQKSQFDFPGTGETPHSVELKIPADAPARTYEVTLKASKGAASRSTKVNLVVLPKPAPVVAGAAASKPAIRGNVYMDRDGFIRFGNLCGSCSIDGLVPFGALGTQAKAAQATGKHRLLRVARSKVKGKAGVRSPVRVKLFPKAQRAIRRGRKLTGVLVFRKGRASKPEVRKVYFRQR
jgi:hypothetical protein